MKPLEDLSLMPFGKHQGWPLQDVPANYLHWYFTLGGGSSKKQCPVADYIRRNLHALKKENPDLIWS